MSSLNPQLAAELDADQVAAVEAFGERTLVLAGAGSGKTRVLTFGLAHLLEDVGWDASEILLVTFTRKAAEEMRARAQQVCGVDLSDLRCGTFHALGAELLRGQGRVFSILDEDEASVMVGQLCAELATHYEVDGYENMDPARLAGLFADARENDRDLSELIWDLPEYYRDRRSLIERLAERFQERKEDAGLLDYADLLAETRLLLQSDAGDEIRAGIRAVLVDEVQDLNSMQRDICDGWTRAGAWLVCVGDVSQSVYGWRGASVPAMEAFALDPATTVCRLPTNYRSTRALVRLGGLAAPPSPLRLRPQPASSEPGAKAQLLRPANEEAENWEVRRWATERLALGAAPEDLCVLGRAHEQLRGAERALLQEGFDVQRLGRRRGRFSEIRAFLLACMRLNLDPHDRGAWQRVMPALPVDVDEQYQRLMWLADEAEHPLRSAGEWCAGSSLQRAFQLLEAADLPDTLLWQRLAGGPLADVLAAGEEPGRAALLLHELFAAGSAPGRGEEYLQSLVLNGSDAAPGPGIRLGTIHASKGLEWPHVLVVRCSPGVFPSGMAVAEGRLDEEQRLFYVAVTRAQTTLAVSRSDWLTRGEQHGDVLENDDLRDCFHAREPAPEPGLW